MYRNRGMVKKDLSEEKRVFNRFKKRTYRRSFVNKKSFITGILTGVAGSLLLVLVAAFLLVQNGSLNVTRMLGISDNHTALENKIMDKVNVIEGYIDQYFLDKIDEDKMADAVYKGVINGLNDTYAAYYTSDEYKQHMCLLIRTVVRSQSSNQ